MCNKCNRCFGQKLIKHEQGGILTVSLYMETNKTPFHTKTKPLA